MSAAKIQVPKTSHEPPVLPLEVVQGTEVEEQVLSWRVVDGAAMDHCHWHVRWFVLRGLLEVLVLESGY